jgi:hypothetical protein
MSVEKINVHADLQTSTAIANYGHLLQSALWILFEKK